MSKVNIVLDATMLDTFLLCPAKFNFRFNLNKVTEKKAVPLDRGDLLHYGLENYYSVLHKVGYEKALDTLTEAVRFRAVNESDLDPEEWSRLIDVLLEHCKRWRFDDEAMEILTVEQAFSYVLFEDDDIRIIMIGKIDLLAKKYREYENVPFDHKSYSRDSPVHRKTNQFCNYAYATGSNYLFVNRIGLQTSIKPEVKHKRISLSYDPLFLEQWRQNVITWCRYYLECAGTGNWPLNDTSCDKFNRLCEYYEICDTSGNEGKIFKLEANFKTAEVWDVSKPLKDE
jgi:hypothetical protein